MLVVSFVFQKRILLPSFSLSFEFKVSFYSFDTLNSCVFLFKAIVFTTFFWTRRHRKTFTKKKKKKKKKNPH